MGNLSVSIIILLQKQMQSFIFILYFFYKKFSISAIKATGHRVGHRVGHQAKLSLAQLESNL